MAQWLLNKMQEDMFEAWESVSPQIKAALGKVRPSLENEAYRQISEAAKTGSIPIYEILGNLENTAKSVSTVATPAPATRPETEKTTAAGNKFTNGIKYLFQNKWVKRISIGIGVLVLIAVAILLFWFFGGASPQSQATATGNTAQSIEPTAQSSPPQTFIEPQAPIPAPVDPASANWLGPIQLFIYIIGGLVVFAVFLDAKERGQISDAWFTSLAVVLIMTEDFWVMLLKGPLESYQFTDVQLHFVIALSIVLVAITLVMLAAWTGGVDLTPLAGFLAILAIAGLLFGTFGAIQTILKIPDYAVLPLNQVLVLIQLKKAEMIWMSLYTYALLGASTLIFGEEVVKSIVAAHETSEKIFSGLASVGGIIIYAIVRSFAPNWPYLASFSLAIAVAVVLAALHPQFGAKGGPLGVGEKRVQNALIPPWDKLSFQLTLGLLLIVISGRI